MTSSTQLHKRKLEHSPEPETAIVTKKALVAKSAGDKTLIGTKQLQVLQDPQEPNPQQPDEGHDSNSAVSCWLQSVTPESSGGVVELPWTPQPPTPTFTSNSADDRDIDHRDTLESYNVLVHNLGYRAPDAIKSQALAIVNRHRPASDVGLESEGFYEELMSGTMDDPEVMVQMDWEPHILPPKERRDRHKFRFPSRQVWCRAPSLPQVKADYPSTIVLPKPKPDRAIGFSKLAFSDTQMQAITYLLNDNSGLSNYGRPDKYELLFPFVTFEWTSLARPRLLHVAASQNAYSGALMLHSFEKLRERGEDMPVSETSQPFRFSITSNQMTASVYVHWAGGFKTNVGGKYWMSERLFGVYLDKAGVTRMRHAVLNMMDFAEEEILPEIQKYLDTIFERNLEQCNHS